MKLIYFFLILSVIFSSCSSYKATVKRHDNLQYEAVRVHPDWKYKEPKGKKWITPVIGLSAGAAYGYYNETTYNGKTYKGAENAAIWGIGGLLVGGIINGILFPKHKRKKSFDIAQSDKWLESYNKSFDKDYIVQKKEFNNTLILVPKYKAEQIRREFNILKNDLEHTTPITKYHTLQNWKNKLNGEYSILPSSEINEISTTLKRYEQKVANNELLSKVKRLNKLNNSHSSIASAASFKQTNSTIYLVADESTKHKIEDIIQQKMNLILNTVMPEENIAIKNVKEKFYAINSFYDSFHKRYSQVSDYEQVKKGYAALKTKKTAMLQSQSEYVKSEINRSSSINQLNEMEKKYFSNVDDSKSLVITLKNQINNHRNEILESERQKELAKEQRQKQQEKKKKTLELEEFQRLMIETTLTGEPTEWQMEFAVNYQIQAKIGQLENYNNLDTGDNPAGVLLKLFGSVATGTKAKITSFEKYGCVAANGKPGFSCDYVAKINLSGNNPMYSLANQLGGAEIKTARFTKNKGIWILLEYMD